MCWYSEFILWVLGATIKFAGKRKFIWNGEDTVVDKEKIELVAELPDFICSNLPFTFSNNKIYQSKGLIKHIAKRHEDCLPYISRIPDIIKEPDFIGTNPNEQVTSFELIKKFEDNIQIGIKLDAKEDYFYVATLHDVTDAKIAKRLTSGRLKNVDKTLWIEL